MHIDDFIPTLANACEQPLMREVYNIGGSDYRSVSDLAEIVLDHAGGGRVELIPEDTHNIRSKRPDIERARTRPRPRPDDPARGGHPAHARLDAGPGRGMSTAVRRSLYGKMAGDTTLTNMLGDSPTGYSQAIYYQQAPRGAKYPYVIFNKQAGTPRYTFGSRAYDNDIWLIKGDRRQPRDRRRGRQHLLAPRRPAHRRDDYDFRAAPALPAPRVRYRIPRNRRRRLDSPCRVALSADVRVASSSIHAGTSSPPRSNSCIGILLTA